MSVHIPISLIWIQLVTYGYMHMYIHTHTYPISHIHMYFPACQVRELGSNGTPESRRMPRAWVLISNTIPE